MTPLQEADTRRVVTATGTTVEVVVEPLSPLPPDHVRVELRFVGVCHSDIAAIASGSLTAPTQLGHEAAGVVVRSQASGIAVGARVIAYVGDAYASHVDVPVERLVVVDPACSMLDAALAEPVACVIGALEKLRLTDCSDIVVVGAGFMGLLATRYLTLLGHFVTAVEPIAARRELALSIGAARALAPDVVGESYPDGAPVVIEASGGPRGLTLAGDLVTIDGTLGILGYHQSDGGMRTVPMERWNYRGISVLSLHHRSPTQMMRWIDRAQRSAAQGGIVPSVLVDATYGLDEVARALAPSSSSPTPVKAVLALD